MPGPDHKAALSGEGLEGAQRAPTSGELFTTDLERPRDEVRQKAAMMSY
jgi:hypothetical protein